MMDVLCCCNPSNLQGTAPPNAALEIREWQDEDGNTGRAYASNHMPVETLERDIPGFIRVAHKGKGGKTWRKKPTKTWKK